jgi:DnaJ-class molecular chaperone
MYGRSRAEREWMADVAAQMIRDELLDDEEGDEEETREVECPVCKGVGVVLIATGFEVGCETCEGTGLLTESED